MEYLGIHEESAKNILNSWNETANDKEIQRAVNVGTDSWCNTMSGLNCKAVRLSSEAELIEVLQDWQNKEGPLFVELPFEPEEYANTARRLR